MTVPSAPIIRFVLLGLATAFVLAACGSDEPTGGSAAPDATTASRAAIATPSASSSNTCAAWPRSGAASPPTTS